MANPITWRNVSGNTGVRDASVALDNASQSIMGGLNRLGKTVQDQQNVQEANRLNARENNNNALLDSLSGFKSSEELETAMQDGSVDSLFAQLGGNVDPELKREAAETRLNKLYDQENAAYDREATNFRREAAPKQDKFRSLLTTDPDAARAYMDENEETFSAANMLGTLTQEIDTRDRQLLDRKYSDAKRAREDNKIKASDQMDEIIADAVNFGGGSDSEAFGLAMTWAKEADIPAGVMQQKLAGLEDQWSATYGLTGTQREDHNQFVQTQAATLEQASEQANADYERTVRAAGVDPTSVYASVESASLLDAEQALAAKGYDPEFNAPRVTEAISEILEDPEYAQAFDANSPALLAIATQAISRLGDAYDLTPGKDNIGVGQIKKAILAEMPAYGRYLNAADALEAARVARDNQISTARQQVNTAITTNRDKYRAQRRLFAGE